MYGDACSRQPLRPADCDPASLAGCQQIDEPKQQAAMSGVNWPEQWEIVAAVPHGGLALRRHGPRHRPVRPGAILPDARRRRRPPGLCRLQRGQNSDQRFLGFTSRSQRPIAPWPRLGSTGRRSIISTVRATAHACLTQEQATACAACLAGKCREVRYLQRAASAANWRCSVGNTPGAVGIDQAGQPVAVRSRARWSSGLPVRAFASGG